MTPQQPKQAEEGEVSAAGTNRFEWFYVQRGETYGPVSSTDLCAAAHLGFLKPEDMVRRSDKADWVVARSIHGLFKK